jgi:hypothetical protein
MLDGNARMLAASASNASTTSPLMIRPAQSKVFWLIVQSSKMFCEGDDKRAE